MIDELQSIVYISSHDLRAPLINIDGFSGSLAGNCVKLQKLLVNEDISENVKDDVLELIEETIPEDLQFITEGTKKMKALIDGLLQVSRVGTVEVEMGNLDMNEIVENIISNVSFRAKEKCATVTCQNDLPPCYADSSQINQLFSNLIDNSIKYLSPERKGKVRISGYSENGVSYYSVKDNGIGIDKQHQQKIFEVYHRLNPSDGIEGEGLGLTIIRRILDRYNGSISLESTQGEGSEFFVTLPTVA